MYIVHRFFSKPVFERLGIRKYYIARRFNTLRGAQIACGLFIARAKSVRVKAHATIYDADGIHVREYHSNGDSFFRPSRFQR